RARRLFPRARVRVYYDGACAFCRRTVACLGALDIYRTVTVVDFRTIDPSSVGLRAELLDRSLHVIDERGRVTRGAAAVAQAARAVPLLAPLALVLRVPGVAWLAERAYGWVAARRLMLLDCPDGACELHPAPALVARPAAAPAGTSWRASALRWGLLTLVAIGAFG